MRRAAPISLLRQEAIGGQLEYVGGIRTAGSGTGSYLYRDDVAADIDDVVRFAREPQLGGEEGTLGLPPAMGIDVGELACRKAAARPAAPG
jgi:hypothetical protein